MAKAVDVGDAGQVKRRKSKADLKRERDLYEMKELLSTEGGRAFIWRLLECCGMRQEISIHPQASLVGIGRQHIGRWVENEVFTSDLDAYTLMHREAKEREEDG